MGKAKRHKVEIEVSELSDESLKKLVTLLEARSAKSKVWDFLTKLSIPLILIVILGGIADHYRITALEQRNQVDGFTKHDAAALELRLHQAITAAFSKLPPEWLQKEVRDLKQMILDLSKEIRNHSH